MAITLQGKYAEHLEIENKQLREQLQLCRKAINEIKEELNKTIDAKDKIINEQVLEIARLKEWKEDLLNENITLENIRKEAIEYIKKYGLYEELTDYDENDNLIITGVSDEKATKELLEILEGNNNE